MLLIAAVMLLVWSSLIYFKLKRPITDYSKLNKYKLSKNNILIKLKLFKYDNRFNYLLLIPYLTTWGIFFVSLILYIIYWCGVSALVIILGSSGVYYLFIIGTVLLLGYLVFLENILIPRSYTLDKYNFPEDKTNDEEEKDFISKEL